MTTSLLELLIAAKNKCRRERKGEKIRDSARKPLGPKFTTWWALHEHLSPSYYLLLPGVYLATADILFFIYQAFNGIQQTSRSLCEDQAFICLQQTSCCFSDYRVLILLCRHLVATIQPTTQNKTKQLGWCGIIISKKTTTPPPPPHRTDYILSQFQAT